MGAPRRMEYFYSEQEALLDLAARIEKLLETASRSDYAERLNSLTDLRSLEHALAGIVEHCHAGNRIVESSYYQDFRDSERAQIDAEHQRIIQAVQSFREEVKCATGDRTMAMILPGMNLVKQLRSHISFERGLFERIVKAQRPQKKAGGKKRSGKGTHQQERMHRAKKRMKSNSAHVFPYTLERHPEL